VFTLLVTSAVAAPYPLYRTTLANNYLMDSYFRDHTAAYNDAESRNIQLITALYEMKKAAVLGLSNFQLYMTAAKWDLILCLVDASCPTVVFPPTPPFGGR
jgi:hypothetical protein